MPEKPKGLRAAMAALKDVAADFATIDVRTYTGKVDAVLDPATNDIDLTKLTPKSSAVKLVAYTHIEFDLDAVNFRSDDAGDVPAGLLDVHQASVDAAIKGRAAVLKVFADLIPK